MEREVDKLFGITPMNTPQKPQEMVSTTRNAVSNIQKNYELVFAGADGDFDEDFQDVKRNLRDIIRDASDKILKLGLLAEESEKASDFVAYAQLMSAILSANKQLIDIYEAKKKYYTPPKNSFVPETAIQNNTSQNITIEKAVFTGTTADLKKHIEDLRNSKD